MVTNIFASCFTPCQNVNKNVIHWFICICIQRSLLNKLYFKLQTEIRNSFKIPWNFFVYLSISGCQVSLAGIISGVPID